MYTSTKLKLFFLGLGLLALPQLSEGATLTMDKKTWKPEIKTEAAASVSVRNNFDLESFVKSSLTDRPTPASSLIFGNDSISELEKIQTEVNQATKSAKLVVEGNYAKEFEPGQDGRVVDVFSLYQSLLQSDGSMELPVIKSSPKTTLAETNNIGIKELLAVGESDFSGSPNNRIINIRVGSSKFHGIVVKPGEEFSFNKFLGDVDAANGFLPELVIKREGLVAEFGGGLCQVSSTVFRAAMNAGLPITERRNHSFAVKYYAPQGTDATIYPGVVDFKFKNDFSSHLIMRPRIEGAKLYFDFYGTKDSRVIEFDGPTSYDKQLSGAMKAIWSRKVTKNSETSEQVFRSNYVSPALYQRVTTVQPSTQNPQADPTPPPNPEPEPTPTTEPAP